MTLLGSMAVWKKNVENRSKIFFWVSRGFCCSINTDVYFGLLSIFNTFYGCLLLIRVSIDNQNHFENGQNFFQKKGKKCTPSLGEKCTTPFYQIFIDIITFCYYWIHILQFYVYSCFHRLRLDKIIIIIIIEIIYIPLC